MKSQWMRKWLAMLCCIIIPMNDLEPFLEGKALCFDWSTCIIIWTYIFGPKSRQHQPCTPDLNPNRPCDLHLHMYNVVCTPTTTTLHRFTTCFLCFVCFFCFVVCCVEWINNACGPNKSQTDRIQSDVGAHHLTRALAYICMRVCMCVRQYGRITR